MRKVKMDDISYKAKLAKDQNNLRHFKFRKKKVTYRKQWLKLLKGLDLLTCKKCGYNKCFEAIDFHHIDPETKKWLVCDLLDQKITKERVEEVYKCIPLCANCHRELHASMRN
jgi:hypothetical protein